MFTELNPRHYRCAFLILSWTVFFLCHCSLLIFIGFTFFIRSPVPEGPPAKVIPKGFDELGRPLDDDGQSSDVILMDDDAAEGEERIVPSGFDAEGHPLEEPLMTAAAVGLTASEEAARRLAASAAAMGIMAPAKRSKGQFLQSGSGSSQIRIQAF